MIRAVTRSDRGFWPRGVLLGTPACLAIFLAAGCSDSESAREETEAPTTYKRVQAQEVEKASNQPNIVFILADDLDYASTQQMPETNSLLAEEGASFEETFISHPLCCPSRATILTGLYDHNHGVLSNVPPDGGFQRFVSEGNEENTIAVHLQEEGGYQTGFFGKYLNGYPSEEDQTHVPPGWDEWYGELENYESYGYQINENGQVVSYGNNTEDYFTDVLSNLATDFVRRASSEEQPFFAYVAPIAPHSPATPAERHKGTFANEKAPRPPSFDEEDVSDKPSYIRESERISEEEASNIDNYYRKRLESIQALDEMVASLIKELEDAGELDDTYIFFTSDNGWEQGEHRIRSGKNRPYEESAHVPLFIRGPGVPAGSKTKKLALNTDFAPTFADLAGVPFLADGRSLEPLLGGEEPSSWRSSILLEKLPREDSSEESKAKDRKKAKDKAEGEATTDPGGVPLGGPRGKLAYQAVRTETHKYVEYNNGEKELYDLEADPYELDNLYESADATLLEDLKAKLDALKNCVEAGCHETEDAS
jgi:N-acetylglucosamine-6-sulfatase